MSPRRWRPGRRRFYREAGGVDQTFAADKDGGVSRDARPCPDPRPIHDALWLRVAFPLKESVMNIVLVHGSYAGAWIWELIRPDLERRGHRVTAIDLPISDPDAGAEAYARTIVDAVDWSDPPSGRAFLEAGS